ncbi:MAG: dephospho-CoA kinase [Mogibacterium sp.]|nr:dephospho-CoA kinase [Mogibacterium sp.]
MKNIVITGGIGSGKSSVCKYLEDHGFRVVYADKMARELTSSGGKAIPYIIDNFGVEYIKPDGSMDRNKIRELVYNNPNAMELLEKGTTLVVKNQIDDIRKSATEKGEHVLFYEIPLFFENDNKDTYDSCWLVTADIETRISRVIKRDNQSREYVLKVINKQMPDEEKIKLADEVIYNEGSLSALYERINYLLVKYKLINQ